jgi:Flp pilus assembly protein TadG
MINAGLLRSEKGASAAEFALVLPILLFFLLGIIDGGRLLWTYNRLEKAAQAGARFAAVTNFVPSGLAAYSFATGTEVTATPAGAPVPTTSFNAVDCNNLTCTRDGAGPLPGYSSSAFNNIVSRMSDLAPQATADKVIIRYENVGLGYSGDPYGADVAPAISVTIRGVSFTPVALFRLGTFTIGDTVATITAEDSRGSQSN